MQHPGLKLLQTRCMHHMTHCVIQRASLSVGYTEVAVQANCL